VVKIDTIQFKKELQSFAEKNGIDQIGFASADPFLDLKERLIHHREKGYESGFEEPDLDKRTLPGVSLPEARSIIAIAIAYPSKMVDPPKSEPGAYRGILSRSAWGQDYHRVLMDRLNKLEQFILSKVSDAKVLSMVDTGVLSDRAVAERAGIGWSAKNCSIISPKLGSWIYLGEMITNIPIPPDHPIAQDCGECTKCMDACPTGAIVGPGQLNAQSCISFLTQTKGFIDNEYKKKIGNRLYGCDTCQVVCPKNKGLNWTQHEEFQPDPEVAKPLLQPLLFIGKKEFKEKFGHSSAAWRGKKPIQRNAVIALGNFKDRSSVPLIAKVLSEDPRPELRESAAWSLGEIGGDEAIKALETAKSREKHTKVLSQLDEVLKNLQIIS
jgi:epoxyqueuosine reductase